MERTRIFVSYSHRDLEWLNRVREHVAVLERLGLVDLWSDQRIGAGADWEAEIEAALTGAKVAVLLVSPAFLASKYIWECEMRHIIAHSRDGMDVWPLIVRPCAWKLEKDLLSLQARPAAGRELSTGSDSQVDADLAAFTYELAARVGRSPAALPLDADDGSSKPLPDARPEVRLLGEWVGEYNRTRPIRLDIGTADETTFHGRMEYPDEGTATAVTGQIHTTWRADDPAWLQVDGGSSDPSIFGVGFQEAGYLRKGSSSIDFQGEYRAIVSGNQMIGAWFAGTRLVGVLTLVHE